MLMPEASVHKYSDALSHKYYIGPSRQIAPVQPETQTILVQR